LLAQKIRSGPAVRFTLLVPLLFLAWPSKMERVLYVTPTREEPRNCKATHESFIYTRNVSD
jgi:hypothetical protein